VFIKEHLGDPRARYRKLTDAFVDELKARCTIMSEDERRTLMLELFVQDVQVGLDAAGSEKQRELIRFVEGLWDKYATALDYITEGRDHLGKRLAVALAAVGYVH
jgi:hypothetical protein